MVIEEFLDEHASVQPGLLAYFYCTRNNTEPARANPVEILRCILKQLSATASNQPIRRPVVEAYKIKQKEAEDDGSELAKLTLEETVKLVLALLQNDPATIVIDALDECDPSQRHDLLIALIEIINQSANLIKVFVSSRNDNDIVRQLAESPNIFINASDNGDDIKKFVQSEVDISIKRRRLLGGDVSKELKDRIVCVLLEKAGGM